MTYIQAEQDLDELVNHIVRKCVAKKVMKNIHHQVDEIEQQITAGKNRQIYCYRFWFCWQLLSFHYPFTGLRPCDCSVVG